MQMAGYGELSIACNALAVSPKSDALKGLEMASELLHMELQNNLTELDTMYSKGEISAAEYLDVSNRIEERIDYLIEGELEKRLVECVREMEPYDS